MLKTELLEVMSDSHEKGTRWQKEFAEMAIGFGLHVTNGVGREDMIVSGLKVQCKNIDEIRNGWVCIDNMRPVKANGGERGYLVGEYDVLALKHRGSTYLIPADRLVRENNKLASKIQIDSYREYQNRWCVFDSSYVPNVPVQPLLPFGEVHQ